MKSEAEQKTESKSEQKTEEDQFDNFMYNRLIQKIQNLEETLQAYENEKNGLEQSKETSELEDIAKSGYSNKNTISKKKSKAITDIDKISERIGNGKVLYGIKLGKKSTELDYIDACEELKEIEDISKPLQLSLLEAIETSYSDINGEFGDNRDRLITLEKGGLGSYAYVNDKGRKKKYNSPFSIKIHTFDKKGKLIYTEQLKEGLLVVDRKKIKKFRKPKIDYFDPKEELLKDKGITKRKGIISSVKDWFSTYTPLVYSGV